MLPEGYIRGYDGSAGACLMIGTRTKKLIHMLATASIIKPLLVTMAGLLVLFALLIRQGTIQLLEPAGYIAGVQSKIILGALVFAGIVAGIIIGSFFIVVTRYKEGRGSPYTPEWTTGKKLQLLAWGVPFIVICGISVLLWDTAHVVDPYRSISSSRAPVTVQVVALRWKWLFIYPNDRIATVNMFEIPVGRPVSFQLTADAPMNSFWIPRLSGQVYAMTGMVTELRIRADKAGTYIGSPAEMSGDEFAGMDFAVKAVSEHEYQSWKTSAQAAPQTLDYASYTQLAKPSGYNPAATYRLREPNLFEAIVMQFMVPGTDPSALDVKGTKL